MIQLLRWICGGLFCLVLVCGPGLLSAQEAVKSGLQPGEMLPGGFHAFNINGEYGIQRNANGDLTQAGRYHCLVCEYGLAPVALVFARDKDAEPNENLVLLLKKLEEAVTKDPDSALRSFAVMLSPHGRSSITAATLGDDAKVDDFAKLTEQPEELDKLQQKLVDRAVERAKLQARLEKLVKDAGLKKVIVTYYPEEGPKGYNISDKAEVTILLYNRHQVVANFACAPGQLTAQEVDRILQAVNTKLVRGTPKTEAKETKE